MEKLAGTGVALATPFTSSLEVDYEGLKKLLDYTADGGVDYYVVQGTTGESATTTENEKARILRFVKENNKKGLPVIYGLGGNNTSQLLEYLQEADLNGVDAILSVSPAYNKPSQEGIYRHYITLADHSPVPLIMYNVPGRTSSNITAETILRLSQHPRIIGIKEASGDLGQCMEIAKGKPESFLLISGDDLLTLPMMSIGAVGVISVLANGFPAIFQKIVHEALKENYAEARKAAFALLKINPLMYKEGSPGGIKEVLKVKAICGNYVRLPLAEVSQDLQKEIKEICMGIGS